MREKFIVADDTTDLPWMSRSSGRERMLKVVIASPEQCQLDAELEQHRYDVNQKVEPFLPG